MEKKIKELEERIEKIEKRNKKVESDKGWETCILRKVLIIVCTYIIDTIAIWNSSKRRFRAL